MIRGDWLLTEARVAGAEVANDILDLVHNPRQALEIFAPEKLQRIDTYSRRVDYAKCIFFSTVLIVCAIRLLLCIPTDMQIERTILSRFDSQRRRECRREFAENNCDSTSLPALLEYCAKLELCIEDEGASAKLTVFRFLISVISDFFYFLTPKAAAGLGVISAVLLYFNLFR